MPPPFVAGSTAERCVCGNSLNNIEAVLFLWLTAVGAVRAQDVEHK
jgi:hypothetical protein